MSHKQWIVFFFKTVTILSVLIFLLNYIVDPYNITKQNLLGLKYKFISDDRTEKVAYFKTLQKFDNIMIGSSRVYSINPKKLSELLGGTTYNFGVGTATVEDHLGILKYLIREDKIPKNLIIGIDYYTFNPDIPPNSYFLQNKELNFLTYTQQDKGLMFTKLFSLDALRGSVKTIKYNYFKKFTPRFDTNGWAGRYEDYTKRDQKRDLIKVKEEIQKDNLQLYFTHSKYKHIDAKRVAYYEEIRALCEQYGIELYLFTTPLHPYLLQTLQKNPNTRNSLSEFVSYLSSFEHFTNLYHNKQIYNDLRNFHGSTHTSSNCGDTILEIILQGNSR